MLTGVRRRPVIPIGLPFVSQTGFHLVDRSELERRLVLAASQAIEFAATMVRQKLPLVQRFLIEPNQSYDGNPLEDDQELFPEDSLPRGKTHGPFGAGEAADWLWRRGKIPEWIDVRAFDADEACTTLWL